MSVNGRANRQGFVRPVLGNGIESKENDMSTTRQVMSQHGVQKQTRAQKQGETLQEAVDFVREQSLAEVQSLLETMAQRGEMELDLLPDFEEEDQLEDIADFDAEQSLADEDAPRLEESSLIDVDFGDGPFVSGGGFEIQVFIGDDGRVKCIPPDNEWASARHVSYEGKCILDALNQRFRAFEVIAKWLEHEENSLLALGAEPFLARHVPMQQKDFILKYWEELGFGEKDNELNCRKKFFRHVRNAFLSWQDASIPLRKLFS